MEKIKYFIIVVFGIFYWICNSTSCTMQNEEDFLQANICDTIDVSYHDLTYIFTEICSACHSEVFTYRDGIKMDSYNRVKSSINTGLVLPAINQVNGVPPMPKGASKLSDCELDKIKAWINDGMPENK
jgi:cytochrome c5